MTISCSCRFHHESHDRGTCARRAQRAAIGRPFNPHSARSTRMITLRTSFASVAFSKSMPKMQFAANVVSQLAMCCIVGPRLSVGNEAYECRASDGPGAAPRPDQNVWIMSKPVVCPDGSQGRDASHRTRNLDTHLTHGCIQHFRHFSRQRLGSALARQPESGEFPPFLEAADRQRGGVRP